MLVIVVCVGGRWAVQVIDQEIGDVELTRLDEGSVGSQLGNELLVLSRERACPVVLWNEDREGVSVLLVPESASSLGLTSPQPLSAR